MSLKALFSPKGAARDTSDFEVSKMHVENKVAIEIEEVYDPIAINQDLSAGSIVTNVHCDITIKNKRTEGTEISNVHGNIFIYGDAVNSTDIDNTHGGVLILAPESARNIFINAVHNHSGIASPEITSVNIDATHGTATLKAETLKDIDIYAVHDPVVIDARHLQRLENVSINTVHKDLLIVFDPCREQETRDLVSQIKFQSVHGQITMIPKEADVSFKTDGAEQSCYKQITSLPGQPLRLEHHR